MIEYLTEQEVLNMDTNYIIETKNLTKQYGSQKSVADLNIHVKRGRIYGLLGRNGAGKTTTMKMLLGLTKPTSGEVKIWGKSLQGNEKKLLPRIGSLIESPGFYPNLTGTENLRIFATLRGVPNNHATFISLKLFIMILCFFRKPTRPSLPIKKVFFESLRLPLAKGSSTS